MSDLIGRKVVKDNMTFFVRGVAYDRGFQLLLEGPTLGRLRVVDALSVTLLHSVERNFVPLDTVTRTIEAEPELPGPVPEYAFERCRTREGAAEVMRGVVRATKRCLVEQFRGMA